MKIRHLILGILLLGAPALAQETVYTNRATELRAAPDFDAKIVQNLAEKSPVQVLERKGPWSRVKTEKESGWVRMMHLRGGVVVVEAQAPTATGSALSGFSRLIGGGSGNAAPKAQSATVGIRGLSAEDIGNAAPNPQALAKVKSLRSDKVESERFAGEIPLAKVNVAEMGERK
jgi:hypothetical protein